MGKGGKGFKLKTYKPPPEKFLVVVNAWGYSNDMQMRINALCGWFEVMMRQGYARERPKVVCVYYQGTHNNFIVELPAVVKDIRPFLGTHPYAAFLTNGLGVGIDKAAFVYEYNFTRFNHPDHTNWKHIFPTYEELPEGFPIADPYPLPIGIETPNPPPSAPWAIPVPPLPLPIPAVAPPPRAPSPSTCSKAATPVVGPSNTIRTPTPVSPAPIQQAPSGEVSARRSTSPRPSPTPLPSAQSSTSAFTPYVPPSHHPAHSKLSNARAHGTVYLRQPSSNPSCAQQNAEPLPKKMDVDPYDEEEEAQRFLSAHVDVQTNEGGDYDTCDEEEEAQRSPSAPLVSRKKMDVDPYDEEENEHHMLLDPLATSEDCGRESKAAEDFLSSILPTAHTQSIKAEPVEASVVPSRTASAIPFVKLEPCEPSLPPPPNPTQLVKLQSPTGRPTARSPFNKREESDYRLASESTVEANEEEYEPSAELLAALAGVDPSMLGLDASGMDQEPRTPMSHVVKQEPSEPSTSLWRGQTSDQSRRSRSPSRRARRSASPPPRGVKKEPVDDRCMLDVSTSRSEYSSSSNSWHHGRPAEGYDRHRSVNGGSGKNGHRSRDSRREREMEQRDKSYRSRDAGRLRGGEGRPRHGYHESRRGDDMRLWRE